MYSFDMKNIVPKESLTCLVTKATSDESMLCHRRLGHINFKNINKLVKDNLVRGLPTKRFENDQTCVACLKGKQHRASLVTNDYSMFTWVFFLTTKDETSEILKNFIKEIENLVDKKVKIIKSDDRTEFKNKVMDDFCREKGIKREYSVASTPQQNSVAERRNRTLIEAARTMLTDSKLPTTFWAEAVSTACYVQNRVLVVKPHNKTPYELFRGFKPALSFMRPFGCHVTILNTLDNLGKFDGKSDEGFFVGYSLSSKAFRVYNTRTRRVEENLHIGFLENKPMIEGNGPKWLFDIDSLTQSMNYVPVAAGTITNESAGTQGELNAGTSTQKEEISQDCIVMPIWKDASYFDSPSKDVGNGEPKSAADDQKQVEDGPDNENDEKDKSEDDSSPKEVNTAGQHVNTASPEVNTGRFKLNTVDPSVNTASSYDPDSPKDMFKMGASHTLETTHVEFFRRTFAIQAPTGLETCGNCLMGKRAIGTKWVFKNKKDERGIVISENKARLFLAYASFMGFLVYQMDVESAFLYGTIKEEVYVTQPPGFKDPDYPEKVYKVIKAVYGLHQAPRACQIQYALIKNPKIYVSLIQQFWGTTTARTTDDGEVEITASIDGQVKTITETSLRRHLKLEDSDGITSLSNTEIFEQLALMRYVSDSARLTFQKGHFSPQWRFFIHTILHCLSLKTTAWEQFSSNIATAIICLAINRTFNLSKMIFDAMVKNLDNTYKFLMYPRFLQICLNKQKRLLQPHTRTYPTPTLTQKLFSNMKRVSKGYSRFPTQTQVVDEATFTSVDVDARGAATSDIGLDAVMSSASSAVTYTSVYTDSEPGRVFWGADEEISDGGSPRVIVYGYDGLPMQPVAPPSPDYVPGPEHPPSPDYVSGPEHPPSPVYLPYVPEPEYPEYLALSYDEAPTEDQSLPDDASHVALSSGYVPDSDPEKDPEEDSEEEHADYPTDGGDGNDEPSDDDDDDDDIDDKEEEPSEDEDDDDEEEAPADSSAAPAADPVPSAGDIEAFETDESAPTPFFWIRVPFAQTRLRRARKTVRLKPPMSASIEARIAEYVAAPTPPLPVASLPLPLPSPLTTNPTDAGAPLGYRTVEIRMRAAAASPPLLLLSTSYRTDVPEAEISPRKRACFTTPAPGFEIEESSAAGVARRPDPTPEADAWDEIVEAMMEITPTTLEGVDQRVTKLDTTVRQRTEEFQVRFEEAYDDRAYLRARVNTLFRDRPYHCHITLDLDREVVYARIVWTGSEERIAAIEAHVRTLEAHVATLIAQTTSLQTQLTTTLGHIETLKARDPEPQDGPAEASSSC
ncbi:putative ribonuclease H-like domain-containing protein [Tanacetum coccineum]